MMSLTDALDRYFAAWNDHDPDAVVRSLAEDGSYEDPTTGGPLTGDALAENVAALLTGFPDLHFDLVSVAATSDTGAAAQWLMRGTNTGPMPAGPATGQTVALPGADFIDYDPAADRISKGGSDVISYVATANDNLRLPIGGTKQASVVIVRRWVHDPVPGHVCNCPEPSCSVGAPLRSVSGMRNK